MKVRARGTDRRKRAQRLLWISDPAPVFVPPSERRIDADTRRVLTDLFQMVQRREVGGIVTAAFRSDGRVDLIATGLAFDYPVLASGAAVRLTSLLNAWFRHPSDGLGDA